MMWMRLVATCAESSFFNRLSLILTRLCSHQTQLDPNHQPHLSSPPWSLKPIQPHPHRQLQPMLHLHLLPSFVHPLLPLPTLSLLAALPRCVGVFLPPLVSSGVRAFHSSPSWCWHPGDTPSYSRHKWEMNQVHNQDYMARGLKGRIMMN